MPGGENDADAINTKTTKPQTAPRRICRMRTASKATRSRLRPTRDNGCHRPHMKVPPESNSEPRTAPRMFENNSASQRPRILADLTTFLQEPLRKPGASVRLNPSDVRKNARSGRS